MLFVSFCWKLNSEFVSASKQLVKTSVIYIKDFTNFKTEIVENMILYIGPVTHPAARKAKTFLENGSLYCVQKLIIFSWEDLDGSISTWKIIACDAHAIDSQIAQVSTALIRYYELVLLAGHPLETTSRLQRSIPARSLCYCNILIKQS